MVRTVAASATRAVLTCEVFGLNRQALADARLAGIATGLDRLLGGFLAVLVLDQPRYPPHLPQVVCFLVERFVNLLELSAKGLIFDLVFRQMRVLLRFAWSAAGT